MTGWSSPAYRKSSGAMCLCFFLGPLTEEGGQHAHHNQLLRDPGSRAVRRRAGRTCGRPQTIGLLCARHHKAAESRWADAIEREKARLARSAASAREIETKRARLADLDIAAALGIGGGS